MALIAYRPADCRAEIEDVRGVAVNSHIVKTLLEREWIRIVGYRDVPGKPAMFATTKAFLDHFNLLKSMTTCRRSPNCARWKPSRCSTSTTCRFRPACRNWPMPPPSRRSQRTKPASTPCCWELDDMEQGIKTDFDDLLRDGASEPDAQE